ncbi:hypothetical protein FKM82_007287 [Ascaphus truei]
MESCFKILLVFEAITLVFSASILLLHWSHEDSQSIEKAIDIYNAGLKSSFLFKLLRIDPQYRLAETADESKLKFMIRETVCPKSAQQNIEQCAFKENGLVKSCTATSDGSKKRTIVVDCDTVTAGVRSLFGVLVLSL